MLTLSEEQCISAIREGKCFQASVEGVFSIKIDEYSFFVCAAIHDGHNLRSELVERCALTESERLYEEDPYTGELISSMPITIVGHDSRYEYDLNRSPESCVYEEAWGKSVWQTPLSEEDKSISLEKHRSFYRVFKTLMEKLQEQFSNCLVYDIHSYNHERWDKDTPVFNLGTEQVCKERWQKVIEHWVKTLATCPITNVEIRATSDEVFWGRGYLATFIRKNFNNILVLPTEIKKVFMNEQTGDLYPLVFVELKEGLKQAILSNALYFSKHHTEEDHSKKAVLLSTGIEPALFELDRKLYQLCKGIETLFYINPKNLVGERKRFYSKNYNYTPTFTYRHLDINPFEFREKLYRLPVEDISDVSIQQLYRDVIDAYATKIDLIASVGTEKFLYNSLRYYGEPRDSDVETANFLLFAKEFETEAEKTLDATAVKNAFVKTASEYSFHYKVELNDKIVASAMVDNIRKSILIKRDIKLNQVELEALISHELGVHMVTTVNSELQKLKVFKLGLPNNTYTQEGLAILGEYLSGNLSLSRLKKLALRVLAIRMMLKNYDFARTFKVLMNDYGLKDNDAFKLTTRVYRGGGFTKDFLYLKGLRDVLKIYKEKDISTLFIGKTSFDYLNVIDELIERKIVTKPTHLPVFMQKNVAYKPNAILDYLISSIR